MPRSYLPLLDVDLTSGETSPVALPRTIRKEWVGGAGLGLYLLSQELRPGLKPSDADCPVFILSGPLTGTTVPSSSDCTLTTLNPDLPTHVCSSHAHGYFGARLRQIGWDGIVVRGRASAPVYLWVEDGSVELRPADDLWGSDTFETPSRLRALAESGGGDVSVACIGPAGENLVWGSCVRVDEFSGWNHGGSGVVWGGKNLKAIAIRGEGSAPVHDAARLESVVTRMAEETAESAAAGPPWPFGRRFLENQPMQFEWGKGPGGLMSVPMAAQLAMINGKNFTDTEIGVRFGRRITEDMKKWKIESEASWNCEIACHHRTTCTTGPMAGLTVTGYAAETIEEVGPNLGIEDPGIALMLCFVVDGYGMKASSAPRIIGMLMEAFNAGEIGLEETGGIDLTWGNYESVLTLLDRTVNREGLGELIAQGFKATASSLGIEHRAVHMKWDGFQDYDQRAAPLFLFSSQVVSGAGLATAMDNDLAFGAVVLPEIGVRAPLDPEHLDYIPEVAFKSARWMMWKNCTGMCDFAAKPISDATHVEAVSAATGEDYTREDALLLGERLLVLQRLIQLYLGFSPDEDFVIAQRLVERINDGPAQGIGISAEELRQARDEFYGYAGFSIETGAPSPACLARLGLDTFTIGRPS